MRQPTRQDRKAKRTGPDGQVRTGGDPWKALSLPPVSQIGIVTRDLPKTVEHYSQVYGMGRSGSLHRRAALPEGRTADTL